ncbi:MAG: hypothetical protein ACI9WU_003249, partial [Myxococcota bacterium]
MRSTDGFRLLVLVGVAALCLGCPAVATSGDDDDGFADVIAPADFGGFSADAGGQPDTGASQDSGPEVTLDVVGPDTADVPG